MSRVSASRIRERARHLQAAKAGRAIALVLPICDQLERPPTSEQIVRLVEAGLCDGLLDEVVLLDNAEDAEVPAAGEASQGVVHRLVAGEVAPEHGGYPGRGEAVWKSLFATRAEILVVADSSPELVETTLALLESLLADDDRTLATGYQKGVDDLLTTFVARPLLALHAPQLSRLRQPLSRNWAVRRDMLEMLPVPVGAGADIALLLDVEAMEGVDAIAEVALPSPRREPAPEPWRAAQIVTAIERRMPMRMPFGEDPVLLGNPPVGVEVRERPPAAGVAGYAKRFG